MRESRERGAFRSPVPPFGSGRPQPAQRFDSMTQPRTEGRNPVKPATRQQTGRNRTGTGSAAMTDTPFRHLTSRLLSRSLTTQNSPSRAQTRTGAILSRLLLLLLLLLLLVLVLGSPSSRSTPWNPERTGSQQAPNRLSTHNPIAEQPQLPPARFSGVLPCRQGV